MPDTGNLFLIVLAASLVIIIIGGIYWESRGPQK